MRGLGKADAMQRYIKLVDKLCSTGAMPLHVTLVDEHMACKAASKTQADGHSTGESSGLSSNGKLCDMVG